MVRNFRLLVGNLAGYLLTEKRQFGRRFYDPEGNLIPLPEEAAQETSGRGTGAIKCYSASSGSGKTAFSTAGGWFAGNGRDFISNVGVKTVRRQT
jgi:hypothetical protein